MKNLKGKVAFVTGSAMGIGKGIAISLASYGVKVMLADLNDEVYKTSEELNSLGYETEAYKVNVTNKDDIKNSVNKIIEKHGKIDILVNNAGVAKFENFLDMSDETRDFHFNVNILGVWNVTKEILPYMVKQNYGKIVNTSSVTGILVADPGEVAYSVSKAAIIGFTKSLAREMADKNITVNAICPGYIMTPLVETVAKEANPDNPNEIVDGIAGAIPMGRLGKIEEAGELVSFLSSDSSSYITGTYTVIDGGSTLPETITNWV